MSVRSVVAVFAVWVFLTLAGCAWVHAHFALSVETTHPRAVVATVWSHGRPVARAVLRRAGDSDARLDAALAEHADATLVYESIVGEGPVLARPEPALALSFVAGNDGLAVTLAGRTELLTPDDLLSHQAYERGVEVASLALTAGLDVPLALGLVADQFGTTVRDLYERGTFRRIRVVRSVPGQAAARRVTAAGLTRDDAWEGALEAARYLARGVDDEGRFRYLVDAPSNRTLPGYDWPRHAGATYFVAQAAARAHEPALAEAAKRAAAMLRDRATVDCGAQRCIGEGSTVDLGSSALSLLAFVEIAGTGLDPTYRVDAAALAAFLRAQQRPDGEFMHLYDRQAQEPRDVQFLYYSGEAALALSRASALLADGRLLEAARRGLAHLVGPAWRFFGSRYYFGEEHWTCQAMDDLWDRAPDRAALDFCLRWQAFGRSLQYRAGESSWDAEGAYGVGPLLTPRLTPAASRSEAGLATLDAARRAGVSQEELMALEAQSRRSLALLLRHQLRPGARHLFADPAAVQGAMPASEVDWQLRIDFAQHAGSALLRWLDVERVDVERRTVDVERGR